MSLSSMPRTSPRPDRQIQQVKALPDIGAKGQRTRARILEEAERLMLEKGYDATTIGDIADACGIRRASFYTYFTSKQDVLMAIGHDAEEAGLRAAALLGKLTPAASVHEIAQWVEEYLAFWDQHGSFVYAAYQAAYSNPELREWSLNANMAGVRVLKASLRKLHGGKMPAGVDPLVQALALQSLLERFWYHWRVGGAPLRKNAVAFSIAQLIWASVHPAE